MNVPRLAFPSGSIPHELLSATADEARIAVICGLPAMGKSLILCELALIAGHQGRVVHCLQWDITLQSFNLPEISAVYPEIDGVTDPIVRRAAGLWVRQAVSDWWFKNSDSRHLLVVEAPLVGGRFIELAQMAQDSCESVLGSDLAYFLVPTPTTEVRAAIQAARISTAQHPRHVLDEKNARPTVVDALWKELVEASADLGIGSAANSDYSSELYFAVYARLLRRRRVIRVPVQDVLNEAVSPYMHQGFAAEVTPAAAEAVGLIRKVKALGCGEADHFVRQWYQYCRDAL